MAGESLIPKIVEAIKPVPGVAAIVLGGSRAAGTHTPDSDFDIGILYHRDHPLDIEALGKVATQLDDQHRAPVITPVGGWGPWVIGGGWLNIQSTPVDFIYRDLVRVSEVIHAARSGQIGIHFQHGYDHGFVTSIYMAEIAICQPLWDPAGKVATLKALTHPYPVALKNALVEAFGWQIDFAIAAARKCAPRADVPFIAGCCSGAVAYMNQVLFALNEKYCPHEKGATATADTLAKRPPQYKSRIDGAFKTLSPDTTAIAKALDMFADIAQEVHKLRSDGLP